MRDAHARVDKPQFLPPLLSQVQEDWIVPTRRYPTRAAIADRLDTSPRTIRVVTRYWWPPRSEHLHAFAGEVLRWAAEMRSGEWIYWVHPIVDVPLTAEEAEQIIGLAGTPELIERDELPDGAACLVIAGRVRTASTAIAIAWPRSVLLDREARARALQQLRQAPEWMRTALHCVGVPADAAEFASYDEALGELLHVVAPRRGARVGVYLEGSTPHAGEAVSRLRARLGADARSVSVQWRSVTAGSEPMLRVPDATFDGVAIDCSLGEDDGSADAPYYVDRPYAALDFDLRRPTYVATPDALVSWPRSTSNSTGRRWCAAAVHARLGPVLDRATQLGYLAALEQDRGKVGEWHHYHVYNWAPPPADVIHLLSADIRDVGSLSRKVADCGTPILPADRAIAEARRLAGTGRSADARRVRDAQIAAHGYLAEGGRHDITADGEALIARLPEALGDTLEIGFGYGLTARRVAARAGRYVGIDLQTDQGKKLREYGASGLVADIHWLPLAGNSFDTVIADNVLEHAGSPLGVLSELHRVLRPGGRIYALIPPDGVTSEYQIRTHLWKSDEWSLRAAAERTGFTVVALELMAYAALGVYGCFPASRGQTCLVIFERTGEAAGNSAAAH